MLTEKECNESLDWLYALSVPCKEEVHEHRSSFLGEKYNLIKQLIEEHFSNPPLEWEEIKVNDVIFDKELKETIKIKDKFIFDDIKNITFEIFGSNRTYAGTYEEKRFYRKEVQE